MNTILNFFKKIPIDLGQGNLRHKTYGKIIALNLIKSSANNKIALDVGCWDGYFSKILKKKGYEVISIDIEKNHEKCQIIDVNKGLPFIDKSFDLIWCSEVIEHLKDPIKTIKEFKRVLKPEGIAIFTTPNSEFWLFKILKIFGISPQKIQNPGHQHFFGIKDIQQFAPDKIYGFFPYLFLKFKIKKLINLLSPTFIFTTKK